MWQSKSWREREMCCPIPSPHISCPVTAAFASNSPRSQNKGSKKIRRQPESVLVGKRRGGGKLGRKGGKEQSALSLAFTAPPLSWRPAETQKLLTSQPRAGIIHAPEIRRLQWPYSSLLPSLSLSLSLSPPSLRSHAHPDVSPSPHEFIHGSMSKIAAPKLPHPAHPRPPTTPPPSTYDLCALYVAVLLLHIAFSILTLLCAFACT